MSFHLSIAEAVTSKVVTSEVVTSKVVTRSSSVVLPRLLLGVMLVTWFHRPTSLTLQTTESNEYCQWETFNATCSDPDEVILMLTARYGRMQFGRCMREDHGSVGCSADVITYMDRKCSGRRTCQLTIPDASLHAIHQCPKEIMPYLEATYTCINVKSTNRHSCSLFGAHSLRSETGYLQPSNPSSPPPPSTATTATNRDKTSGFSAGVAGTPTCPWLIQMRPGQRINLTLFNFHLQLPDHKDAGVSMPLEVVGRPGPTGKCASQRIVVLDRNRTVELALCGEKHRERHLFTTDGSTAHIYLQPSPRSTQETMHQSTGSFLIKYQAVGCPDITDPFNAWVIRRGETAVVKCNFTGETFFLTCINNRWKGELSRCATVLPTKSSQTVDSARQHNQNHGILIVIGIGVALGVALGVFILFALILCHRRRKEDRCRTGERLYPGSSLTELDERKKSIVYLPGRIHNCSTGGCSSLSSTKTASAVCLCNQHPYNAAADCSCCPSQHQTQVRSLLQPSQHCRAVEALLINCSANPADDQSGLSYQKIQMTPVTSRKVKGSSVMNPFSIDDPQHQQTVFVTFKPMTSCVSGSSADAGSQSVARTDLDLVRDSISKDQLSLSSSHDDAPNESKMVTS